MRPACSSTLRILIVDDTADTRELFSDYLQSLGYAVLQAANGLEAIEISFSQRPSLIVMDLAMPVMDGLEATRILQTDSRTCGVPIIVVTGSGSGAELEAARLAGCAVVLSKPCVPSVLGSAVERVLAAA